METDVDDRVTGSVLQSAEVVSGCGVERIDESAAAEVSDQDSVAERPEVCAGFCHAPGRIELAVRYEAPDKGAVEIKDVDDAESGSGNSGMFGRILQGIGHEDLISDDLKIVWSVAGGQVRVDEGSGDAKRGEERGEGIDVSAVEVGDGEVGSAAGGSGDGEPGVDGSVRGIVHDQDGALKDVAAGVAVFAGDGSVFGGEEKGTGEASWRSEDSGGIVGDAGWVRGGYRAGGRCNPGFIAEDCAGGVVTGKGRGAIVGNTDGLVGR